MPVALEKGSWELVFNGDGVSGWENEKVLEMDGGDDHTAVWMCSMPQNSLSVMVKKASITLWIFHCNTNLEKLLYMIFSVDKFKDWIRSIPVFWVPSWGLGWEFKYRSDKLRGFNLGVGFYLHHFLEIMGSRGYFFTKNFFTDEVLRKLWLMSRNTRFLFESNMEQRSTQKGSVCWSFLDLQGRDKGRNLLNIAGEKTNIRTLPWRYLGLFWAYALNKKLDDWII